MQLNRIAVSIFFLINGFLYGNWAARLPGLQQFYHISNSELGALLFTMALGAILAMPFTGVFTAFIGNKKLTFLAALLFCLLIPLIAMWPNYAVASVVFFGIGVSSGSLDVSMNGQAVYVERLYGRPIMSSFHAVFSIGMPWDRAQGRCLPGCKHRFPSI
ncbi:MAG: hypothetical protein JNJ57_12000 [Saprospiraceae bacterium]|nr:hypothetical protein [Saprospiraceae bacterium]